MVLHIFAVELRYAERLLGLQVTEYSAMPTDLDGLFATAERAAQSLRQAIADGDESYWSGTIEFSMRSSGTSKASRRKIFVHALLHGVRHWAQLAVELRKAGHATDWGHHLLFSNAVK